MDQMYNIKLINADYAITFWCTPITVVNSIDSSLKNTLIVQMPGTNLHTRARKRHNIV